MRLAFLVMILLSIVGCNENVKRDPVVQIEYKVQEVPVPVPCKIQEPEKPASLVKSLKPEDDIFTKVKTILAERELKKAYVLKLETAIQSCNQSE